MSLKYVNARLLVQNHGYRTAIHFNTYSVVKLQYLNPLPPRLPCFRAVAYITFDTLYAVFSI